MLLVSCPDKALQRIFQLWQRLLDICKEYSLRSTSQEEREKWVYFHNVYNVGRWNGKWSNRTIELHFPNICDSIMPQSLPFIASNTVSATNWKALSLCSDPHRFDLEGNVRIWWKWPNMFAICLLSFTGCKTATTVEVKPCPHSGLTTTWQDVYKCKNFKQFKASMNLRYGGVFWRPIL